jgi:hypothetical protein
MEIRTLEDFDKALANGAYAWPGGYPLYFVMEDGEAMSFDAAKAEAERIREAIAGSWGDGWRAIALEVNWEDAELYCCHSGERIPSAYAEHS